MDREEVLFCEYNAAAKSLNSAWTRLASTYGCVMVVLSRTRLIIKPHWFAKWLISLLHLDLFHEIPIANIGDVVEVGKWSSYGKVELQFRTVQGKDRKIVLYLKKYHDFIEKVTNILLRK